MCLAMDASVRTLVPIKSHHSWGGIFRKVVARMFTNGPWPLTRSAKFVKAWTYDVASINIFRSTWFPPLHQHHHGSYCFQENKGSGVPQHNGGWSSSSSIDVGIDFQHDLLILVVMKMVGFAMIAHVSLMFSWQAMLFPYTRAFSIRLP